MSIHPELFDAAEDDDRPLWSSRRQRMLRAVVWVGIAALVLPGVLIAWGVASRTAANACAAYTAYLRPNAGSSVARFELVGDGAPGWLCFSVSTSGPESYLGPLGLIPSAPSVPRQVT